MDQWQTHMQVPEVVEFPAMRRLESQGVSFDRQYCTVPICTPSRATMWTGVHAIHTGLWDNTNFAWIGELSRDIPTIGHLLREQGYYTAFKGKWHLSAVPTREDALEPTERSVRLPSTSTRLPASSSKLMGPSTCKPYGQRQENIWIYANRDG
jgi:arylsulfatase A-like enzyme